MKIALLGIDPQNDFCASATNPFGIDAGSLFVPGAQEDMERLGTFIEEYGHRLGALLFTLDQHHNLDIAHGLWFADENGDPAPPITLMDWDPAKGVFIGTLAPDFTQTREFRVRKMGKIPWTANIPEAQGKAMSYAEYTAWYIEKLKSSGRYGHTIWPAHCLIGTPGAAVYPTVMQAANAWTEKYARTIQWVAKGTNPFAEHFSGVKAEVALPNDPGTQVNAQFIQTLMTYDRIFLAGEALSHCVANTGRDIAAEFANDDYVQKLILLEDASSPVPFFEKDAEQFVADLKGKGMQTMTCAEAGKMLKAA
jgi:nicotinamidase/pyrazinamidase